MSAAQLAPIQRVGRLVTVLLVGSLAASMVLGGTVAIAANLHSGVNGLPPDELILAPLSVRSVVFDRTGEKVISLIASSEDRVEVPLDRVPMALRQAVIAIEDAAFYEHNGISFRSITRAAFSNVSSGGLAEGGSTITQQVIKSSIVGSSQTVQRKVREIALALRLEKQMSKDQILERYLNTMFLGNHAFGVQAAAETYFGKDVDTLTWPEVALIVTLIRGPTLYDPIRNPKNATARRNVIADRLLDVGVITSAEHDEIVSAQLPKTTQPKRQRTAKAQLAGGGYFAEEVRKELLTIDALGANPEQREQRLLQGGLRIVTTYDEQAQRAAEDAARRVPTDNGTFFTAMVSVEPGTGAVRQMVGGPDFGASQFNNATQAWRGPGSTMKPIALITAFEQGYIPQDTVSGVGPCWVPDVSDTKNGGYAKIANFGNSPGKVADITSQTLASSNCAFLRLGQVIGTPAIAEMAGKLGITTIREGVAPPEEIPMTERVKGNLSTTPLGTLETTPIQMAGAYAAIAADGKYVKPHTVERVVDSSGAVLYQHDSTGVQAFSAQTARQVARILERNVQSGTGRRAALKKQPAAGKTGTGNNNTDAWFVGFTPYLATAVWIGNPDRLETVSFGGNDVEGGEYPASTWGRFNAAFHTDLEVREFADPARTTRSGKFIKYTNKKDSGASKTGGSKSTSPRRPTTTKPSTTSPDTSGSNGSNGGSESGGGTGAGDTGGGSAETGTG